MHQRSGAVEKSRPNQTSGNQTNVEYNGNDPEKANNHDIPQHEEHSPAAVATYPGAAVALTNPSRSSSQESNLPAHLAAASDDDTYPEGGHEAYLCVLGSFCACIVSIGLINTFATFQAYLSQNQLSDHTTGEIGWIFGVFSFIAFFGGVQIGPIFDAIGPQWLIGPGCVLIIVSLLLIGLCTQYWHFMLVLSLLGGFGTSLVFTPAIAVVGHYFLRTRGQWTGLVAVGGSLGGIIYPLMLQSLIPQIGFAWSTRAMALMDLFLSVIAVLLIKSRLPKKQLTKENIMIDPYIFRDPVFAIITIGVFFLEWGIFNPLSYLSSYALNAGVSTAFSYQVIAIMNAASCFGRYLPGLIADKIGRFNSAILMGLLCILSTFALWLPAKDNIPLIIVFSVVFGFASGSGISLIPVCVGQLCETKHYGRYYATCITVASLSCLTGIPIAGSLVTAAGDTYWGVIVFTGCAYAASTTAFIIARVIRVGWNPRAIF